MTAEQIPTDPVNGPREPYPARKARQGSIVLRAPARRRLFVGGLAAIVVLLFLIALLA